MCKFEDRKHVDELRNIEDKGFWFKLPFIVHSIVYALWSVPTDKKYVIYDAEIKEISF